MDTSNTTPNPWIPIIFSFLSLFAGSGWLTYYLEVQDRASADSTRLVAQYLGPIEVLLADNLAIKERLYRDHRVNGWGILESYILKSRAGTTPEKNRLMTENITIMAQNNQQILKLLQGYTQYAMSPNFEDEVRNLRKHINEWVIRWRAVQTFIDSDSQLERAEPFPTSFSEALKKEIEIRKSI